MVLAGGEGKRLLPLTQNRAKPAVPIGGKYRIIDVVLSNFLNSFFEEACVLTQYEGTSLDAHIHDSWKSMTGRKGNSMNVVPIPAAKKGGWYEGTADAVYDNLRLIRRKSPRLVAVFNGDHIYKMDIRQMITQHDSEGADLTIASVPMDVESARNTFGVIEINEDGKFVSFEEKPSEPKCIPGKPGICLVSMGNYIFDRRALEKELSQPMIDLAKDLIPAMVENSRNISVYDFSTNSPEDIKPEEKGYWLDLGTLDAFYAANMDLRATNPRFSLYDGWVRTGNIYVPPAKFVHNGSGRTGEALESLVCDGCVISGGSVKRSVLSPRVRVNSYSSVENSVLFDSVNIARYAKIRNAILDENVSIPERVEVGYDAALDRKRGCIVTDSGITIVSSNVVF